MHPETLNEILIHAVANVWARKANLQGWKDEMNSYKATCNMFKILEVAEKVYEYGTTSKTPIREDSNRASHGRKRQGGEVASHTKPIKGSTGNCKTRNEGYTRNRLIGGKTCLLHGHSHSSKEVKLPNK